MPADSAFEFLTWLDVIPGRNWLVVGSGADASGLEQAIANDHRPSAVTSFEMLQGGRLPFVEGTFDVAVAVLAQAPLVGLLEEMRRVIFPSGTVGICVLEAATPRAMEALLHHAGLHAVQTLRLQNGALSARGAR